MAPAVETAVEVAVEAEEAIVGITAVVEAEAAMIVETMAVAEAGEATVETMAVAEVGEETMAVAGAEEIAVAFVAASVASGETVPEVAAEEDGEGAVTPLPGSQRCSATMVRFLRLMHRSLNLRTRLLHVSPLRWRPSPNKWPL